MCREVPGLKRDKSMPGFELRPVNKLSRLVRRRVLSVCNERRFYWFLKGLETIDFSIGIVNSISLLPQYPSGHIPLKVLNGKFDFDVCVDRTHFQAQTPKTECRIS